MTLEESSSRRAPGTNVFERLFADYELKKQRNRLKNTQDELSRLQNTADASRSSCTNCCGANSSSRRSSGGGGGGAKHESPAIRISALTSSVASPPVLSPSGRAASAGSRVKIEDSLLERHRAAQTKKELLRKQHADDEVDALQEGPSLSQGTLSIASRLGTRSHEQRSDLFLKSKKRNLEAQRRRIDDREVEELTLKPNINSKSQSMRRSVEDLYRWAQDKEEKVHELRCKQNLQHEQELLAMQRERAPKSYQTNRQAPRGNVRYRESPDEQEPLQRAGELLDEHRESPKGKAAFQRVLADSCERTALGKRVEDGFELN